MQQAVSQTNPAVLRVPAEQEEYFDVLDEAGKASDSTELRAVCHATGLWHRAVYCFVVNSSGQLLLQASTT